MSEEKRKTHLRYLRVWQERTLATMAHFGIKEDLLNVRLAGFLEGCSPVRNGFHLGTAGCERGAAGEELDANLLEGGFDFGLEPGMMAF